MKRRLIKTKSGGLVGFDEEAKEALKRLPVGTFLYYDITNPRNGNFHKKFFSLLNIIKENYSEKVTVKEVLIHIKDELNMWEVVKVGKTHYKRFNSISFSSMTEDEFGEFYNRAIDVCLELVPIDMEDLAEQVAQF